MDVVSSEVETFELYHLLTGIVTPRPIAWVTTISSAGVVNLAPFSFFNVFSANPPIVAFSPTLRRDGTKKDTLRNLEVIGEFVIHSATEEIATQVNLTAKEIPADESEVVLAGLATRPSRIVRPPSLVDAKAALECVVRQIIPLGTGPIAGNLVLGEVKALHVSDTVFDAGNRVDPTRLRTVARLGGDWWCRSTALFEQKRP